MYSCKTDAHSTLIVNPQLLNPRPGKIDHRYLKKRSVIICGKNIWKSAKKMLPADVLRLRTPQMNADIPAKNKEYLQK